jgi:hypothetical protein
MADISSEELRMRRVEEFLKKLSNAIDSIGHKLGQVSEDNARDARPLPSGGGGGCRRYFAQADGVITGSTGNTFGTGSVFLLQAIDGARYQMDPPKSVDVLNSTTGAIPDLSYLEVLLDTSLYSVVVGSCTPAEAKAPDPPES